MTHSSHAILEYLAAQRDAMIALLAELVNIDSGSYNKAGVDAVGARLRTHLETHGVACETISNATYGDCLRARVGGGGGKRNVLIMGHRDTVFPDGTAAARPFRIEGTRATGPGVADMKSGLVMNSFVLEAFQRFGGAPYPLVGLYTADEEIASPSSRTIIEAEARQARAVFNSEPGRPTGNVVSQRKGAAFLQLRGPRFEFEPIALRLVGMEVIVLGEADFGNALGYGAPAHLGHGRVAVGREVGVEVVVVGNHRGSPQSHVHSPESGLRR